MVRIFFAAVQVQFDLISVIYLLLFWEYFSFVESLEIRSSTFEMMKQGVN